MASTELMAMVQQTATERQAPPRQQLTLAAAQLSPKTPTLPMLQTACVCALQAT